MGIDCIDIIIIKHNCVRLIRWDIRIDLNKTTDQRIKLSTDANFKSISCRHQTTKGTFSVAPMFGNESMQFYDGAPIARGRYFNKIESQSGAKVCVINERTCLEISVTYSEESAKIINELNSSV